MSCQHMEKNLIAYLDGKADVSERHRVEAHLAECGECRARAEQFRSLWGVLDEWPAPAPSPDFDARALARVSQEPACGAWWAWLLPSPRAAFALTVVVLLSVWLSSVRPSRPNQALVAQTQTQAGGETDFKMIEDLPVLEDYDVISNFDALSDLPASPAPQAQAAPRL
jgi:anti-sigma factor RsiW